MIIPAWARLGLLILAGITPRWQLFFTTSTDYSMRGLAMPLIDSVGIACVIAIARTRNPLIDGDPPVPVPVVTIPGQPLETHEAAKPDAPKATPKPDSVA